MTPHDIERTRQTFTRIALSTMTPEELADAVYVCSGLLMAFGYGSSIEACQKNRTYGAAIKKMIAASNQAAIDLEAGVN